MELAPLDEETPDSVRARFVALIKAWANPNKGYTARRAMFQVKDHSDYDHLARYGEWDTSGDAVVQKVGS